MKRAGVLLMVVVLVVLSFIPVAAQTCFDEEVSKAAKIYGINPTLIHAVIGIESACNSSAVSGAGAIGLMQLMPSTAKSLNVDPYDSWQNILGGTKYLYNQYVDARQKCPNHQQHLALALACYNAGPGRVLPYCTVPNIPETMDYVAKVNQRYLTLGNGGVLIGQPNIPAPMNIEPRLGNYVLQADNAEGVFRAGEPFKIKTSARNDQGYAAHGKIVLSFHNDIQPLSTPGGEQRKTNGFTIVSFPFNNWNSGKTYWTEMTVKPLKSGKLEYLVRVELMNSDAYLQKVSFPYYEGNVVDAEGYPALIRGVRVQ